jgi:hypothetical protein
MHATPSLSFSIVDLRFPIVQTQNTSNTFFFKSRKQLSGLPEQDTSKQSPCHPAASRSDPDNEPVDSLKNLQ